MVEEGTDMTSPRAADLIALLDLARHPEGGWFRETWRAPAGPGKRGEGHAKERASASLILFLLEMGQRSHWHCVDAAEIWLWHSGNALQLSTSTPESGTVNHALLGPDLMAGQFAQHVIAPGVWQAAEPLRGAFDYTLVSCVVSPGFEFSGFTLAPPGWHPLA